MWNRCRTATEVEPDRGDQRQAPEYDEMLVRGDQTDTGLESPARHRIKLAAQLADDMRQTGGKHRLDVA